MVRIKALGVWCLYLGAALWLPSCGYQFSGSGQMPRNIQKVHVALFENRTSETGIETLFTNALISELTRNGVTVVSNPAAAEAIFTGNLHALTIETISRRGVNTPQERRITLTVHMRFLTQTGDAIWPHKEIKENETYDVVQEKQTTEVYRQLALIELSQKIAENIYDDVTGQF